MYNDFFGFRERPFNVTPDPRMFYSNLSYQRIYADVYHAVCERTGVAVLTGEAGTGKTTLLRRLIKSLEHAVHFAFCPYTALSFAELVDFICDDLELPQKPSTLAEQLQALHAFLCDQRSRGQHSVLLIDEAHNLQREVLAALAQLAGLEVDGRTLLPIVLVGHLDLEEQLQEASAASLKEYVVLSCRLKQLEKDEVGPFIFHRLSAVGYNRQDIFPPSIVTAIAHYSQGIPRYINTICDNALVIACTEAKRIVTRSMIEEVARDLQLALSAPVVPAEQVSSTQDAAASLPPMIERKTPLLRSSQSSGVSTSFHGKGRPATVPMSQGTFSPMRPQFRLWAGLGAVGLGLFFFFSYFPLRLTPQSEVRAGVPRETAAVEAPPSPPSSPPSPAVPSPGKLVEQHPFLPPTPTLAQPKATPSKKEVPQFTIATALGSPLSPTLEPRKKNIDRQRDPFSIAPSAYQLALRAKVPSLLPPVDKGTLAAPVQEKKEKGQVQAAKSPVLLSRTTGNSSQEVKTAVKTPKADKSTESKGATPLILAVMQGQQTTVQKLLKSGANVNEQNAAGRTPLMVAALTGRMSILQTLLRNGATVDTKNAEGWTALMYAAWNGHTAIVQTLVRNGAKVNTKNLAGDTALTHATRNGHQAAARILRTGQAGTPKSNVQEKVVGSGAPRSRDASSVALVKRSESR